MSNNMEFNFGDVKTRCKKKGLAIGGITPKDNVLNLDLPGESQELTGENKIHVQDMIKATNQNNFFTSMNQKYQRSDFLIMLKPEQIQKYAKDRIFKEMVQGKIDYTIFGFYYNDSKFLENLLIAAQDELINNSIIRDALGFYNNSFPGNQNIINLLTRYDNLAQVYHVLFDKLSAVKNTGNVGYLADIQYILAAHKNTLI